MKKLLCILILFSTNLYSQKSEIRKELDLIQNEINLNAYKYVVIENLGGDAQKWGVEGFSDFIEKILERRRGSKKKYNVVSIKEGKPDELLENPALGLYIFGTYGDAISSGITLDSNLNFGSFIGTNDNSKVYLEFYDHNDNILKIAKGSASNFHSSVIDALRFMTKFDYKFEESLVGSNKPLEIVAQTQPSTKNSTDLSVEDAIKRLKELKSLLDEGLLSQDEFDKASDKLKKIILN